MIIFFVFLIHESKVFQYLYKDRHRVGLKMEVAINSFSTLPNQKLKLLLQNLLELKKFVA